MMGATGQEFSAAVTSAKVEPWSALASGAVWVRVGRVPSDACRVIGAEKVKGEVDWYDL